MDKEANYSTFVDLWESFKAFQEDSEFTDYEVADIQGFIDLYGTNLTKEQIDKFKKKYEGKG